MGMYISGIASGIDTDAWIEAVMALERRPITQLQQRKNGLQQQKDAWRDINTRLNNLSSRLSDLRLSNTYLSRTATSSNADVLSVSAGTAAVPGRYEIQVIQLAQAHRVSSDRFDPGEARGLNGTIHINGRAIEVAGTDTLQDIADKINGADAGVTATIIDGHLVLRATELNKAIDFVGGGGVLTGLGILNGQGQLKHELQAPQAARLVVDGISVTRNTNTISDLLPGVTLTLQDEGTAVVVVQHDVNRAVERIRAFVEQYNSVQSFISDKTGKGQILQGDALLQRIQAQLRQDATAAVHGSGLPYNQLAMIGISVDRYGTMTLDEAKLRAALSEDPDAVRRLFAATPEADGFAGVAVRLGERLETWLQTSGGLLVSRQQMLDSRMQDIDRSIERLEARLALREQTLRRQFVALEEVLSAFQTQAMWLEGQIQQLNAFAGYYARRR